MAFLPSKIAFPLKISFSMLVGYLLATIPPVVLDPILLSHVGFKEPRHYPEAWLIIPIAIVLFTSTLILAMRSAKRREVFAMLPFVAASLASIPIFRPRSATRQSGICGCHMVSSGCNNHLDS